MPLLSATWSNNSEDSKYEVNSKSVAVEIWGMVTLKYPDTVWQFSSMPRQPILERWIAAGQRFRTRQQRSFSCPNHCCRSCQATSVTSSSAPAAANCDCFMLTDQDDFIHWETFKQMTRGGALLLHSHKQCRNPHTNLTKLNPHTNKQ